MLQRLRAARGALILVAVLGAGAYALYRHPPLKAVGRGEIGLRQPQPLQDLTRQASCLQPITDERKFGCVLFPP